MYVSYCTGKDFRGYDTKLSFILLIILLLKVGEISGGLMKTKTMGIGNFIGK